MKEWFNNLKNKYKIAILIILWLVIIIVSSFVGEKPNIFIGLIWLTSLVFGIVFTIWHIQFKKQKMKNSDSKVSISIEDKESIENLITNYHKDPIDQENLEATNFKNINNIEFKYSSKRTFFYVDVETANSKNDTVCSIAAIIIKDGQEKEFYSLINPKAKITNTYIHGIKDSDVVDKPTLDAFWQDISQYINDDFIIIGHNIQFDISVLNKDLERYGIKFLPKNRIDTMTIAKDIYYDYKTKSGDLKLDLICKKLDISIDHHNAFSDIKATKKILESLLSISNRKIEEFINVHYRAEKIAIINNIKSVKTDTYWSDIEVGRIPVYFTNKDNQIIDVIPEYDKVSIEDLFYTSMMNRENCGIERVEKQIKLIKDFISNIGGKCFNKGSKSARTYIEFYYMDYKEYKKLKNLGYKIFHAIDVEEFITNNQSEVYKFFQNKTSQTEQVKLKKTIKADLENKIDEEKKAKTNTRKKIIQMTNDGNIIRTYNRISDAVKATGINSKSIRDCCSGKQKHAGGFVWKYFHGDE